MSSTGERMLELLTLLQVRHRWSGDELAERLGISTRTLRRDVDRLRELGYPIHADRGLEGGYQLGSGTKLPPLLLTDDEAVAIAIGLRTAATQPIAGIAESAMGALVKLGQVLSPTLLNRVESLTGSMDADPTIGAETVALETVTTLARACRDAERARFAYRSVRGEVHERYVEPHHVVPLNGRWYLICWDLERDDWRTFRLDRVKDVRTTKWKFEPRELPAPDPATHIRQTITSLRSVHNVELVVETPITEVAPHLGSWGAAESVGDDTRIEMNIPDLGWAVLMLAILDADIVSVEPSDLRTFLRRLADRFHEVSEAG